MPRVLIIIGSQSDQEYAKQCREQLTAFKIEGEIEVCSAHRHPQRTAELTSHAEQEGFEIIVAMAGLAAALPGVAAAHSQLPVIGVPLPAALGGMDALLATTQMPPGVPVAAMAIGMPGAKNAAVMAARILALKYPAIKAELKKFTDALQKK